MDSESNNIEHLITKSILGKLSREEQLMLNEWISKSEKNRKDIEAYRNLWEKSKKMVYSDKLDLVTSLTQTKRRIPEFNTNKRWLVYLRQIAAILILSVLFGTLFNHYSNTQSHNKEQVIFQEVKAAYGTRTRLQLADGTNVWLNSGSTLSFPNSFKDENTRCVELNGEGFFQVVENKNKPFIVKTNNLNIKVLGTEFTVSAYEDYSSMTVALEKGKISLIKEIGKTAKELLVMKPNDVAEYNKNENKVYHRTEVSLEKYSAWKDGKIIFYGDPIETVVQRLEKWYNVDIELKDEVIKKYRFTATFIDESLEQALNLLSLSSPIKYKIIPGKKQSDNSYGKRKITITNKTI